MRLTCGNIAGEAPRFTAGYNFMLLMLCALAIVMLAILVPHKAFAASNNRYTEGNAEGVVIAFEPLGGQAYEVTIRNERDHPVSDWSLSFKTNFKLAGVTGADCALSSGNVYVFSDPEDGAIAPGGSYSFTVTSDKKKNSDIHNVSFQYEDIVKEPTIAIDRSSLQSVEGVDIFAFGAYEGISGTLDVELADVESLVLVVSDDRGNTVDTRAVNVGEQWHLEDFGLLPGSNTLTVECRLKGGEVLSDTISLIYPSTDRADRLSVDTSDADGDGLVGYLETYFGTDPSKMDTDGDGLDDCLEIARLFYDPLSADTDGDGVGDGSEDFDYDGIANVDELAYGTNPASADSDLDGLPDGDELALGCDPLSADTDGDGARDGWEMDSGEDPLAYKASFQVTASRASADGRSLATLDVSSPGDSVEQVFILPVTGTAIDLGATPGFVCAFDFNAPKSRTGAVITFELDGSLFEDSGFEPAVYWYNEETQMLEEQASTLAGTSLSFEPSHFSIYLVVDRSSFEHVWNRDIKDPGKDEEGSFYDLSFVLDRSLSMSWNDRDWLRKVALNEFVGKLRDGDRASVVGFAGVAETLCDLTSDKDLLHQAIGGIKNDSGIGPKSGTNGTAGLAAAIELLDSSGRSDSSKAVFFLTDGEDNRSTEYTYAMLGEMAAERDISVYVFVLGDEVGDEKYAELESMALATGGKCYRGTSEDLSGYTGIVFDETVDYVTDSNGDGISDYYASLILSGDLVMANGQGYAGIDFSQSADYDGDGLLNGEEIRVCVYYSPDGERYVYLMKVSDPTVAEGSREVTSRDLAIFAALCYEDGRAAAEAGRFYKDEEIQGNDSERGQVYYFLNGANVMPGGSDEQISRDWVVAEYVDAYVCPTLIGDTHFSATVYIRGDDVVLAYRGTNEYPEWLNDIEGYFANFTLEEPYADLAAVCVAKKYLADGGARRLYITGHSLGGYLAQVGAAKLLDAGYQDSLEGCEYFNGMGLDYAAWSALLSLFGECPFADEREALEEYNEETGGLVLHRIYGDPVSLLGFHSGETRTYDAAWECVDHHRKGIGLGGIADILLLTKITRSPEPVAAVLHYGFALEWDLAAYVWAVHETDSFVYRIGR